MREQSDTQEGAEIETSRQGQQEQNPSPQQLRRTEE